MLSGNILVPLLGVLVVGGLVVSYGLPSQQATPSATPAVITTPSPQATANAAEAQLIATIKDTLSAETNPRRHDARKEALKGYCEDNFVNAWNAGMTALSEKDNSKPTGNSFAAMLYKFMSLYDHGAAVYSQMQDYQLINFGESLSTLPDFKAIAALATTYGTEYAQTSWKNANIVAESDWLTFDGGLRDNVSATCQKFLSQ